MAVADILKALHGFYTPTGMYSFEFKQTNGKPICEIFFILPPGSVTVTESPRSELIPTLTGGYLADFGNDFKDIQIQGETHFYYAGSTRNPAKEYGSTDNVNVEDFVDGYSEFIKLRFMISRYRDYTMTKNGKLSNAPSFNLKSLAQTRALKNFVTNQLRNKESALSDKIEMIWHDYDYDDHYKCKVESLSMPRDKSDPWTVQYNIILKGYEVDTKASIISKYSKTVKKSVAQLMQDVSNISGVVHEQTIPSSITVNNGSEVLIINNQAVSQIDNSNQTISTGVS